MNKKIVKIIIRELFFFLAIFAIVLYLCGINIIIVRGEWQAIFAGFVFYMGGRGFLLFIQMLLKGRKC